MNNYNNKINKKYNKFYDFFSRAGYYLYLPLALFFCEYVLITSCSGFLNPERIFLALIFSFFYGLLFQVVMETVRHEGLSFFIRGLALGVTGFFYAVIYFLYCQFQMYYDLNTMFAGAGDAITSFAGDMIPIVVSKSGLSRLFLFMLPMLLYFVAGRNLRPLSRSFIKNEAALIFFCFLTGVIAVGTVEGHPVYRRVYGEAYSFDEAVNSFGLATALRLDIVNISGDGGDSGYAVSVITDEIAGEAADKFTYDILYAATEDVPSTENEPEVWQDGLTDTAGAVPEESGEADSDGGTDAVSPKYGFNVMDLDFSNLEKEDSEKEDSEKEDSEKEDSEKEGSEKEDSEKENSEKAIFANETAYFEKIDEYVNAQQPSMQNACTGLFRGKNLIFLTAEAFSAEAVDEELTPTLFRLANRGIQFTDYYQPASAGTTGGEYNNIFGMLPTLGGRSMKATADHLNWTTIFSRLTEEGYYGKAYHNNDYKYYDRHLTHVNIGMSDGYEGKGNGLEKVLSPGWPESDLEMLQGTLEDYIDKEPFQIYYMTVSGHSQYSFNANAMSVKHREAVAELPYSSAVKAYLACQIELDRALEYLVKELEKRDIADDTVIVLSADHFPYGLNQNAGQEKYLSELYGVPVDSNLVRDHNRLIIWSGSLEKQDPIVVSSPTFSLDILPTLCNLFGVEYDSRLLPGRDVFSDQTALVFNLGYDWKTERGTYYASRGKFVLNEKYENYESYEDHEDYEDYKEYVSVMNQIVRNKITYCKNVLESDYMRHIYENHLVTGDGDGSQSDSVSVKFDN